jgi:preprotein translocase subunit Sss1
MTNALSAMEYPHWLVVAGAILVVVGLIGFGFRQKQGR